MRFKVGALFAFASTLASPVYGQRVSFPFERYRITLEGGGLGFFVDETVIVSVIGLNDGSQRWIAEKSRRDRDACFARTKEQCRSTDMLDHRWIDGDKCPALLSVFENLSQLQPLGFARPTRSKRDFVTDSTMLTVSGQPDSTSSYARMSLSEQAGPLADWWARSERRLASCWTATKLESNGQPIEPLLPGR